MKKLILLCTFSFAGGSLFGQIFTTELQVRVANSIWETEISGATKVAGAMKIEDSAPAFKGRGNSASIKVRNTDYPESATGTGFIEHDAYGDFLLGTTDSDDPSNNGYTRIYAGGTEKMTVTGDGRVGIGTTNPTKKFDVAGDARVSGRTQLGELELGPGYWKTYSKTHSGGWSAYNWVDVVPYGTIKHANGFKLLVRVSNNSNGNFNRFEEVIGACRHPHFSGSQIARTHVAHPNTGVNGEITHIEYAIDRSTNGGEGCKVRIRVHAPSGNTGYFVSKVETM